MKKIYTVIFLVLITLEIRGQDLNIHARALGMGNATVATSGDIAIQQNMAGMASLQHTVLQSSYYQKYAAELDIAEMNISVASPLFGGVASFGINRYGDELFSIHRVMFGFAHQVNQFKIGVRLGGEQYYAEGFGSQTIVVADVGGIARISNELFWGMSVENINRPVVSEYVQDRKPSIVRMGLVYVPLKEFSLSAEVYQQAREKPDIRIGAEYIWQQKLGFRSGIDSRSLSHFLGLGLYHRLIKFDYALCNHRYLGVSHVFTVAYHLKKGK